VQGGAFVDEKTAIFFVFSLSYHTNRLFLRLERAQAVVA
jgi:hypothetical protein